MAKGKASFNLVNGAISDLVVSGCITAVSYAGTGQYSVTLSGAPDNYAPLLSGIYADFGDWSVLTVEPASAMSASGFQVVSNTDNGPFDPAGIRIYIPED